MRKMVEIDIANEDCIYGLRSLKDKSVDFAFIDPPYNVGKDYGEYKDNLPEKEYMEMMEALNPMKQMDHNGPLDSLKML